MKTNYIFNELRERFTLNEIQKKAYENMGRNLIIDAPTASGKTEAILLSIPDGSVVTWMLPTITSCTFMYRRLCRDFNNLNVNVYTSLMSEESFRGSMFTTINLITCDPYMVEYVSHLVQSEEVLKTTSDTLVLDEIDNYPTKVRRALKHYIKNVPLKQVILASATLDEELKNVSKFNLIKMSPKENRIRYKSKPLKNFKEIHAVILNNYKKKRIAVIANSISDMNTIMLVLNSHLDSESLNVIFHHSQLPNEVKMENERRIFEGEYDLLISNDLVSMSLDIDVDLLIMGWSDKLNINIQRMGRLNRRNRRVDFDNLYIYREESGLYPKFINDDMADNLFFDTCELSIEHGKLITSDLVRKWSEMIHLDDISMDELLLDVSTALDNGDPVILRDVPMTLRYQYYLPIQTRKKGKKIAAVRTLVTEDKKVKNLPFSWYYPCSEEDGEKDLLYMPWLNGLDTPNGSADGTWIITKIDRESGIYHIEPYFGESYEYWADEEDDDYYDYDEEYTYNKSSKPLREPFEITDKNTAEMFGHTYDRVFSYYTGIPIYEEYDLSYYCKKDIEKMKDCTFWSRLTMQDLLYHAKDDKYDINIEVDNHRLNANGIKVFNDFLDVYYEKKDAYFRYDIMILSYIHLAKESGDDIKEYIKKTPGIFVNKFSDDIRIWIDFRWLGLHRSIKEFIIHELEDKIKDKYGIFDRNLLEYERIEDNVKITYLEDEYLLEGEYLKTYQRATNYLTQEEYDHENNYDHDLTKNINDKNTFYYWTYKESAFKMCDTILHEMKEYVDKCKKERKTELEKATPYNRNWLCSSFINYFFEEKDMNPNRLLDVYRYKLTHEFGNTVEYTNENMRDLFGDDISRFFDILNYKRFGTYQLRFNLNWMLRDEEK